MSVSSTFRPRSNALSPIDDPRLPDHPMNVPAQTIFKLLLAKEPVRTVLVQFRHNAIWLDALRLRYRQLFGDNLETTIRLRLSGDALADALYLLNATPAAKKCTSLEHSGGTESPHVAGATGGSHYAVLGTTIRNKESKAATNLDKAFGFLYVGADAAEYRWIQLIWRDRIVTEPNTPPARETGIMITTGGEYPLTSDPSAKKYNVDVSPKAHSPYYEETGASIRDDHVASIFDQPSAGDDRMSAASFLRSYKPGTVLQSIAHFDTFLLYRARPVYHYEIAVEDQWTRADEPRAMPREDKNKVQSLVSAAAATSLPAEVGNAIRARLQKSLNPEKYDYLII